jgi:glycosyltransferase involved in cell wall biosynthesis
MARSYLGAGIGTEAKYTRVFSGFDLGPFLRAERDPALAARLGIAPDDFVVGKIARLFELKGHDDLFRVAAEVSRRIPRARFLLVGDGPWRWRFEALARRVSPPGRFIFAGLVPPSAVAAHVGLMDALVHLSRREGLARALPQAMAAGKPVIAYDCDGAGEVCRSGETGILLPPGDAAGLVEALAVLAVDPGLRDRLGAAGRSLVKERFGVERMVEGLDALYRRLLRERGIMAG